MKKYYILTFAMLFLFSCKKSNNNPAAPVNSIDTTASVNISAAFRALGSDTSFGVIATVDSFDSSTRIIFDGDTLVYIASQKLFSSYSHYNISEGFHWIILQKSKPVLIYDNANPFPTYSYIPDTVEALSGMSVSYNIASSETVDSVDFTLYSDEGYIVSNYKSNVGTIYISPIALSSLNVPDLLAPVYADLFIISGNVVTSGGKNYLFAKQTGFEKTFYLK